MLPTFSSAAILKFKLISGCRLFAMLILTLCSVFFSVTGHSSNFFPSASPFDDSNILDRRLANYEQ